MDISGIASRCSPPMPRRGREDSAWHASSGERLDTFRSLDWPAHLKGHTDAICNWMAFRADGGSRCYRSVRGKRHFLDLARISLLCCAMHCFAQLYFCMPCFAMLCLAQLAMPLQCYAWLCFAMLCFCMTSPCFAVLSFVQLCYALPC